MNMTRTWNKGNPPFIGWWNASKQQLRTIWRWWNGEYWSMDVLPGESLIQVERCANIKDTNCAENIEWTDYWPENARVHRINHDADK